MCIIKYYPEGKFMSFITVVWAHLQNSKQIFAFNKAFFVNCELQRILHRDILHKSHLTPVAPGIFLFTVPTPHFYGSPYHEPLYHIEAI